MRRENEDGFTLVELLVVIAIIGVLGALLVVGVSSVKGKARGVQCVNNVRQLGQALQLFRVDSHAYPLRINSGYRKGEYPRHFTSWDAALENEMSSHFPREGWAEPEGVWNCPAAERPSDFPSDRGFQGYGYNGDGTSSIFASNALGLGGHRTNKMSYLPPVTESEVAVPSEMMAIGDGFHGGDGIVQDGAGLWRGDLWQGRYFDEHNAESTKRSLARHQGKANVVFCDGHVESPTLTLLFEDTSDAALVRWNRDHLAHRN